jgi:hypothetical protein
MRCLRASPFTKKPANDPEAADQPDLLGLRDRAATFAISPRTYPCGTRIKMVSASLFFCSDFSGDELKGDKNQAA